MRDEETGLDTKKDKSLVTTADYAAQALISWRALSASPLPTPLFTARTIRFILRCANPVF